MTEHILKIHPKPFADLASGAKTGEIRDCSDRDFKVGDSVRLIMVDETGNPAGKELVRHITHIQHHYGLPDYLCVLSYGQPQREPVSWGAPKSVRQLIQQLETLDQDLRPLSMLRVPGEVFEDGKERTRAVHLSFSHERVDGQWLVPFKSEGEKVVAFWCRMEQPDPLVAAEEREGLIAYGRSCGLDEASTMCSRMAYDTYYPTGSRFKHFIPKALEQQGNLLIKAANAIASLPDGPYDRFKARQQKTAEKSLTA